MDTSKLNPIQRIKVIADNLNKEILFNKEINEIIDIILISSKMILGIIEEAYGKEIVEDYYIYKCCVEHSIYPIKYEIEYGIIENYVNYNDDLYDIESLVREYKDVIITFREGSRIYKYVINKIKFFYDSNFHIIIGKFHVEKFELLKQLVY